jgi:tetratricopeptide (TPR) repeat protein
MLVLHHRTLSLALALLLLASPLSAQTGGGGRAPSNPDSSEFEPYTINRPDVSPLQLRNEEPPCFKWPTSPVVSNMVSVRRLDVPARAREAFDEACSAVQKKNLSAAQQQLNRALKAHPKFAAAWVLLGQVQEDQQQLEQAEQSCTQAQAADSNYLLSYLCLARLAAHREEWSVVAGMTDQVIALHPIRAPGAYFYNALAHFHLKQDQPAESSALRVLEDGGREQLPQVHWLLAHIYEHKGDRASEAVQLREYLKLAPHASDAAALRNILKQIDSQATDSAPSTTKPAP